MRGTHIAVRVLSAAAGGTALAAALAARRVLSRREPGADGRERRLRATFEVRLETGRPPEAARCPTCGRPLETAESRGAPAHVCAATPAAVAAPGRTEPQAVPAGREVAAASEAVAPAPAAAGQPAHATTESTGSARAVTAREPEPAAAPVSRLETPPDAMPEVVATSAPAEAGEEPAGEHGAIPVGTGTDPVLGRLMEPGEAPVEPSARPPGWRPAESIDTWDEASHVGESEVRSMAEPGHAGSALAPTEEAREPHAEPAPGVAARPAGPMWPASAAADETPPRATPGAPWPGASASVSAAAGIARDHAGPAALAGNACAEAEAAVAETCEALDRARDAHAVALERYGPIRRSHADVEHRMAEALRNLDAGRVAEAKAAAQQQFREARSGATSPAEVQAAAAEWLRTLDALNRGIQQASRILPGLREQEQRLAAELAVATTQLDVTRIALETADERCRDAREALAACEEARAAFESSPLARRAERPEPRLGEAPAAVVPGRGLAPGAVAAGPERPEVARPTQFREAPAQEMPGRPRTTTSTPGGLGRRVTPTGLRPGGEPSEIVRLVRGEQAALDRVAAALSGGSASEAHRWQLELAALADAIIEAALDAAAVDPAEDHPFWAGFSAVERREIVAVLASNGFRFDGRQGFVDGRAPTSRDLSLAVGYVGLDPDRVRAWPSDDETPALLRGARIAAAEFLRLRAPDLSLGHMAAMLGPRADDLTQLWNAWGRVRPLLLSVSA